MEGIKLILTDVENIFLGIVTASMGYLYVEFLGF